MFFSYADVTLLKFYDFMKTTMAYLDFFAESEGAESFYI